MMFALSLGKRVSHLIPHYLGIAAAAGGTVFLILELSQLTVSFWQWSTIMLSLFLSVAAMSVAGSSKILTTYARKRAITGVMLHVGKLRIEIKGDLNDKEVRRLVELIVARSNVSSVSPITEEDSDKAESTPNGDKR